MYTTPTLGAQATGRNARDSAVKDDEKFTDVREAGLHNCLRLNGVSSHVLSQNTRVRHI